MPDQSVSEAATARFDPYLVSSEADIPDFTPYLDDYLKRIATTATTADLDTLKAVVEGHTRHIAFENLNSLLDREISTDDERLADKLVHGGRGGFCFEQNLVLRGALDALGFRTEAMPARVVWGRETEAQVTPRTHMLLQIDLPEGKFLVDAGFGGQTMTGVLAVVPGSAQATPHEPFRFVPAQPDGFMMQSKVAGAWQPLYWFDLQPQPRSDLAMGSWYVSTHPASLFRNALMVARPDPDRRHALLNTRLTVHHLDGPSERRELGSASEVMKELEETFLIRLDELPELEAELHRRFF